MKGFRFQIKAGRGQGFTPIDVKLILEDDQYWAIKDIRTEEYYATGDTLKDLLEDLEANAFEEVSVC